MKITIVNRGIAMFRGGGERFDLSLARALKHRGHQVRFVTGQPLFSKRQFNLEEFDTVYLKSPYLRDLGQRFSKGWIFMGFDELIFSWRVLSQIPKLPPSDIYQITGMPYLTFAINQRLARPAVIRMPGPPHPTMKKFIPGMPLIVANGDAYLKWKQYKPQSIANIPPAIDNKLFCRDQKLRQRTRKKFQVSEEEKVIIFSGRLVPIKNLNLLLRGFVRAYRRESLLKLWIIGDGLLRNDLQAEAARLRIDQVTNFFGHQGYEQLNSLYNAADIFAITSWYDNYPNVVLEAMAVGLPIIGTRVGGIPTQIQQRGNGVLIESDNDRQLAQAILTLANNSSLRETMGKAGRKQVDSRTWDLVAEELETVYSRLVK